MIKQQESKLLGAEKDIQNKEKKLSLLKNSQNTRQESTDDSIESSDGDSDSEEECLELREWREKERMRKNLEPGFFLGADRGKNTRPSG